MCLPTAVFIQTSSPFGLPVRASSLSMAHRLALDVEEVHNFLRVHAAAASEAAHEQVMQAQCKQMVVKFKSVKVGMGEATRILEALEQGPWRAEQKRELQAACAASAMTGTCATSQKTQSLLDPDNYLTPSLWKFLEASTYSEKSKLHSYCMFLNKLGLHSPSERTAQHCTAKFWFCLRGQQVFQLDGAAMLSLSEEFKAMLSSFPKPATVLPQYPSEALFWRDMQPELYAQVYEQESPAPSRLDHAEMARLLKIWPCRNSHRRVAGGGRGASSQAAGSGDPMMCMQQMLASTMQTMLQHMSPHRSPPPGEPHIQMLTGNSRGFGALVQKASEVAQSAPPASGPLLPQAQTALELRDQAVEVQHEVGGRQLALPQPPLPPPQAAQVSVSAEPRSAMAADVDVLEASMQEAIAARAKSGAARKSVLKRPAAAPPAHGPPLKRPSGALEAAGHDRRPAVPAEGTAASVLHYLGGRIYDDPKAQRLRCYRQIGDRVEKTLSYKTKSRADCYQQAFEVIEQDPRAGFLE